MTVISRESFEAGFSQTHDVVHLPTTTDPDGSERATCGCDYDSVDFRCLKKKRFR